LYNYELQKQIKKKEYREDEGRGFCHYELILKLRIPQNTAISLPPFQPGPVMRPGLSPTTYSSPAQFNCNTPQGIDMFL